MKVKRKFLSGVYDLSELSGVDALVLKKIDFQGWRAFNITAMPNDKIVYWSYFRRKANRFLNEHTENSDLKCEFSESIKYKSLQYSYGWTPTEYFLGLVVSLLLLALCVYEYNEIYITICIITAISNFIFFIGSKKGIKALTSQSTRTW